MYLSLCKASKEPLSSKTNQAQKAPLLILITIMPKSIRIRRLACFQVLRRYRRRHYDMKIARTPRKPPIAPTRTVDTAERGIAELRAF
jgi:hypothetical protein